MTESIPVIDINFLAVILATLSCFVVGGVWYSPLLFGNLWAKEALGVERIQDVKQGHPAKVFGLSFVFALVAALAFDNALGGDPDFWQAVGAGLLIGGGFVATSFGINYRFAGRSHKLWAIDAAYHVVQFALYGIIFGLL